MPEIRIEIPGAPPSVGHYNAYRVVTPRHGKPFVQCYPTPKAEAWWWEVKAAAAGRKLRGPTYVVTYAIFTASNVCSDVDNYAKCCLDGLKHAGVIDDDKNVIDLHGYRRIDRANPRTVIVVKTNQEQLFGGSNAV